MCLTIFYAFGFWHNSKDSVVRKAIQKVISAMLKGGRYFTCGTDFNRVQLCLNNPKPKKCILLCLYLHLFLRRRQEVSSIPFLHITATCGFPVPRLYVSGSEAKLKVELGLIACLASIRIFLMWSGMFPVATQCKLARERGSKEKKTTGKWAPCQVFIEWNIGAPERNECLELLTLLPYHIATQSEGHTQALPEYAVQLSTETGLSPHRTWHCVLGIHMSSHERFIVFPCTWWFLTRFLMPPVAFSLYCLFSRFYVPLKSQIPYSPDSTYVLLPLVKFMVIRHRFNIQWVKLTNCRKERYSSQ